MISAAELRSNNLWWQQGNGMRRSDSTLQYRELELIDISRDVEESGSETDRRQQKRQRRAERQRKRRRLLRRLAGIACVVVLLISIGGFLRKFGGDVTAAVSEIWQQVVGDYEQGIPAEKFATHPEWREDFLTRNEYSRPGYRLPKVTNIFVHYTANPGSSAAQNRSYFEQQKDTHERSVSSHFIIGYEGEILQCVPLNEVAYAVKSRNYDSISIECCHLTEDGAFTEATYESLIELLAWLIDVYDLESEDILRHYDCGGKKCPLYYTEHEDAWEQLKIDVDKL